MTTFGPRVVQLGTAGYAQTLRAMRAFTDARQADTADEIWLLQHPPVFTQGQAGRAEHLRDPGAIPVVASDRGGQITYHGPGQVIAYVLVDLRRLGLGVRGLVDRLEQAMIEVLDRFGVTAHTRPRMPGVYVTRRRWADGGHDVRKIGSLGLRVRRGCSYHGLALNVDMDLEPFSRIDPCGYPGLRMTQLRELAPDSDPATVLTYLGPVLARKFSQERPLPAAAAATTVAASPVFNPR